MRLPGYLIAFALALLLASTTPVGTGSGVHQFDLLHPLFNHMHLVNGRLMTHEQMDAAMAAPTAPVGGVALGSGGAGSDEGGVGVSPTLPSGVTLTVWSVATRWDLVDEQTPVGREEPPPVPPPLVSDERLAIGL
ncbi:MAG TPA: hypothetical protein VGK33_20490 [Chloroflexota bacterium]|jgi:hypothetical protein